MAEVRLVDLEVIKQFSLAVRSEFASADALLAALDADRVRVLAAIDEERPPAPVTPRRPAPARAVPKKKAAKKTAAAKKKPAPAVTKKTAVPSKKKAVPTKKKAMPTKKKAARKR